MIVKFSRNRWIKLEKRVQTGKLIPVFYINIAEIITAFFLKLIMAIGHKMAFNNILSGGYKMTLNSTDE